MRRLIAFPCEGATLLGTLDEGEHPAALLIVSGGNEIRAGAHRGMAALAASVAAAGHPVVRFDRRGVGDSEGINHGFPSSAPDIAAAVGALRRETPARRIVAFGNCDAASAIALFGRAAGIDAAILANPWVVSPTDDLPPRAAIRARYAAGLRDLAAWRRLLGGGVSLTKLARGLSRLLRRPPADDLARRVLAAITDWGEDASVVLAAQDATALAYADAARGLTITTHRVATASHSFAPEAAHRALHDHVLAALRRS